MSDLRRVAMLDQAAAATRDAMAIEATLAGLRGFRGQTAPGPFMERAMRLMTDLAATEQLATCEHLASLATSPWQWFAWAPTDVLCADCAVVVCRAHAASDGAECDRCRLVVPPDTYTVNGYLRHATYDDTGGPPVLVPPLLLRVGLCEPCQQVEDAAMMADGGQSDFDRLMAYWIRKTAFGRQGSR